MASSDVAKLEWTPQSVLQRAIDRPLSLLRKPYEIATSRPALKAYLGITLFVVASIVLLSISTVAYLIFYYNYIPQINVERTVYLQYDGTSHPHGSTALPINALVSQQPYDVSVVLHMPRTPINLEAGNFMLETTLFTDRQSPDQSLHERKSPNGTEIYVVDRSRRPAILPYSSKLTGLASTLLRLPFHLLSLQDSDATVLTIPMFEKVSFARGKANVPTHALLEIQTQAPPGFIEGKLNGSPHLQIYSSKILFEARFHGLRYLIYNYRVLSFCVFSSAFYVLSVLSMLVAWIFISNALATEVTMQERQRIKQESPIKAEPGSQVRLSSIKQEGEQQAPGTAQKKGNQDSPSSSEPDPQAALALSGLSDTPTTFPTLGRTAPPLQYTPQTSSNNASSHDLLPTPDSTMAGAEPGAAADDEDEDEDEMEQYARFHAQMMQQMRQQEIARDSGIGTSLESEGNTRGRDAAGLTRRRSGRSSESRKAEE